MFNATFNNISAISLR